MTTNPTMTTNPMTTNPTMTTNPMNKKYQNQDHELVPFISSLGTIPMIRRGGTAMLPISVLSGVAGLASETILARARPHEVAAIPSWKFSPNSIDAVAEFIADTAVSRILQGVGGYADFICEFEDWIADNLTGPTSLIAGGMNVSARGLFGVTGNGESFHDWIGKVETNYPGLSSETGFREELSWGGDFSIPLNLAYSLAEDCKTFAGKVIMRAIEESGFFSRSFLREPFADTLEKFQGVIPSMNNGLIDARQARQILGEGASFDYWLNALASDFPLVWGRNYFSQHPIVEWDLEQQTPPPRMKGPVHFTPELMEDIAASPVYTRDYYDFDDLLGEWTQNLLLRHQPTKPSLSAACSSTVTSESNSPR